MRRRTQLSVSVIRAKLSASTAAELPIVDKHRAAASLILLFGFVFRATANFGTATSPICSIARTTGS